jgi:hypothetical protein
MKSLQHLFESNSYALTLAIASKRFSCILFLAFVLMEDKRENILSTTADRGYWASKGKGGELFKCLMLKYTNPKLFSVYRESFFLKWSFFFPIDKSHLSVPFFSFADIVSCTVYKG